MKMTLGKQTAIGAAIGAGVLMIGALAWMFFPRYTAGPQDFLPAEHTLVLLTTPDRTLLSVLDRYVPSVLPPVTPAPNESYALVELDDTSRAWVTLKPDTKGEMIITSDNQTAVQMVRQETPRLSSDPDFRALTLRRGSQAFITPTMLQGVEASSPFRAATQPILIASSDNTLFWKSVGGKNSSHLPSTFHAATNAPVFTAHAASMKTVLEELHAVLDADAAAAFAATLRQITVDMFGTDISAQYDLLPILSGPTTVQIATTGSGIAFAIQTTVRDADDADLMMDKLHEAHRAMLAAPKRLDLTFDDQFSISTLQADTNVTSEEVRLNDFWDATMTLRGGRGLLSASRGQEWIISNDASMLQGMLASAAEPINAAGNIRASGVLSPETFVRMMNTSAPGLLNGIALPAGSGGLLHWSIGTSGGSTTVTLQ